MLSSAVASSGGIQRTQHPIVTGASVLAVKFADGVMLMADTLGSYGSMGMFKALQRIHQVNPYTLLGGGGEFSDLQYILKLLEQQRISDFTAADGSILTPSEIHSYLGRVLYNRRGKIDPLWNQLITAGFYNGKSSVQLW
jgi:20S proteasome subunit beta 7